jgi:pimeloyl-ACP methyl ester carboxylesterase
MRISFLILLIVTLLLACQKEKISIGASVQDLFYVENKGAQMPVLVEGNTTSKIIVLFVHGGPGGTAIGFNNDEKISAIIEPQYAVAYWEQRAAGISQGTSQLHLSLYIDDLKKVIQVLKHRYGADTKVFLLSHSWGGLIVPGFLTEGNNQQMVKGWINIAGAHNYFLNDSLSREYLLEYSRQQISLNNKTAEWQKIANTVEPLRADYTYKTSSKLIQCAGEAENLIDDIERASGGGGLRQLFTAKFPFSTSQMLSNTGATYFSSLNKEIMYATYSNQLSLIQVPLICITGKYDFTVPMGMANEVMKKTGSSKKKLVVLPRSGHISMDHEYELLYNEILKFVKENAF